VYYWPVPMIDWEMTKHMALYAEADAIMPVSSSSNPAVDAAASHSDTLSPNTEPPDADWIRWLLDANTIMPDAPSEPEHAVDTESACAGKLLQYICKFGAPDEQFMSKRVSAL